jgi:hypothetical protein
MAYDAGRVLVDVAHADHGGQQVDLVPAVLQRRVGRRVGQVGRDHPYGGSRAQRLEVRVLTPAGEVVDDGHLVTVGDQAAGEVQADEAGAAEKQGLHAVTARGR